MEPFTGSFLLALRLVGMGWTWGLATKSPQEQRSDAPFLFELARAVVLGVCLNLLPALVLASIQAWTPTADWMLWAILLLVGIVWIRRRGLDLRASAVRGGLGLVLVWVLTSLPLLQPPRSEWLAGGWDPAIYQNNALAIARDNGLQGRQETVFSSMEPADRELFTEAETRYREIFPGVPIVIETGAMPLYFFHLTPVCGAWFVRMGGTSLLFRMPAILALWGLLPMLALCGLAGWGGWRRWGVLACWLMSPMWWYHQAIPTSEMLYLVLLLGGILLYVHAARRGLRIPLGVLGVVFAATVNHLGASVLFGLLLLAAASAEADARSPWRISRILLCFLSIGLAIAWNWRFAGVTVMRLEDKDNALSVIFPVYFCSAGVALVLAWRPLPAAVRTWAIRLSVLGGAVIGCALAAVALAASVDAWRADMILLAGRLPWPGPALGRLVRVVAFHGSLGMAWAGLGLAWLSLRQDPSLRLLKRLVASLGVVCLVLFVQPGIAAIYPWALRRYVVFLVPFLAWVQAFALIRAVELIQTRANRWRWAVLLLFLPAIAQSARLSASAFRVGDYPGFGDLLASLEEAIDPSAIVVADDPLWGTPLMLASGRDVVSGRPLWKSDDVDWQRQYMDALLRLRNDSARRVLWLTSTERNMDIYPVLVGGPPAPLLDISYAYHTVIHSPRGNAFALVAKNRRFHLYEWDGTYSLRDTPQ